MAASGNLVRVWSVSPFYRGGLILLLLACACGDSGTPPGHDGDAGSSTRRLEIQVPPGDQLGLAFAETRTLRVRYYDVDATPLAGAEVSFALVVGPGSDPAGAVLSAGVAVTDASGIASVDVTGGASVTSFRVQVEAENAPPVSFFVSVSNEGFAAVRARLVHEGDRAAADFTSVNARLYGGESCASLDPAAPPDSTFPVRTLELGAEAVYPQLPASLPYTLLAWGTGAAGQLLASGCVELGAAQVVAGGTLRFDVPVVDRREQLAPAYALVSPLDLDALAARVLTLDGWGAGRCPLGAAQLLLDFAIDALGPGASANALAGQRGTLGADGCRAATTATGAMALEARVTAGLASADASFSTRAQTLTGLFAGLTLESRLDVRAHSHTLAAAHVVVGSKDFRIDLVASARPVITAIDVAIGLGLGASPAVSLGPHGFTLRLGSLLADAFAQFPPAPPSDGRFGLELINDLSGPSSSTGCNALSQLACPPAGLVASCLASACTSSIPALDDALARPFVLSDGSGLDLSWSGVATGVDADLDLVAESLTPGVWSVTLTLGDQTTLTFSSQFTAASVSP
jgi:hypothetical protein